MAYFTQAGQSFLRQLTTPAIDFVEGKQFQLIDGPTRTIETQDGLNTVKDAPNVTAIIFYLTDAGEVTRLCGKTGIECDH